MKFLKSKKALIVLTTVAILITTSTPAFAFSVGNIFSDLVKTQKINFFGISPEKITSYIGKDGEINFNTVFNDVSQVLSDVLKSGDLAAVKTAGDQIADIKQDISEVSHENNTKSTAQGVKYFRDNTNQIQQVVTDNKSESESSLEAADKANKLASTNVLMSQQLTKATLDLAAAQQNQNSIEIRKGQIARTERLRAEINSVYGANEAERLQIVARRRFYPDSTGKMVEGNADASTRSFNRK